MKSKLLIGCLLVLLLAANLLGAAGYRSGIILYPKSGYSNTDSTWATTFSDATNWKDLQKYAIQNQASAFLLSVAVVTNDADVDTIHVVTRMSDVAGGTGVVIDSQEVTGSTAYSAISKYYSADSLYWSLGNMITYARVYGDAAGTATQTIRVKVKMSWLNKFTGQWITYEGEQPLSVSFVE